MTAAVVADRHVHGAELPVERVRETAEVVRRLGAEVDLRIYPGMGHTIVQDEIEVAAAMLSRGL